MKKRKPRIIFWYEFNRWDKNQTLGKRINRALRLRGDQLNFILTTICAFLNNRRSGKKAISLGEEFIESEQSIAIWRAEKLEHRNRFILSALLTLFTHTIPLYLSLFELERVFETITTYIELCSPLIVITSAIREFIDFPEPKVRKRLLWIFLVADFLVNQIHINLDEIKDKKQIVDLCVEKLRNMAHHIVVTENRMRSECAGIPPGAPSPTRDKYTNQLENERRILKKLLRRLYLMGIIESLDETPYYAK